MPRVIRPGKQPDEEEEPEEVVTKVRTRHVAEQDPPGATTVPRACGCRERWMLASLTQRKLLKLLRTRCLACG